MSKGRFVTVATLGVVAWAAASTAVAQGRAGGLPSRTPSALRAVPAETTAAKAKDQVEEARAKGLPIPSRDRGSPYAPPVEGLEPVIVRQ